MADRFTSQSRVPGLGGGSESGRSKSGGRGEKFTRLPVAPRSGQSDARPRNSRLGYGEWSRVFCIRLPEWRGSLSASLRGMLYPIQLQTADATIGFVGANSAGGSEKIAPTAPRSGPR